MSAVTKILKLIFLLGLLFAIAHLFSVGGSDSLDWISSQLSIHHRHVPSEVEHLRRVDSEEPFAEDFLGSQAVEEPLHKNDDGEHLSEDLFAEPPSESGLPESRLGSPAVRQTSEPHWPAEESVDGQDSQTPLAGQPFLQEHPDEEQLDEQHLDEPNLDEQDSEGSVESGSLNENPTAEPYAEQIPEESFGNTPLSHTSIPQLRPEALSMPSSGARESGMASIGKVTMLYGEPNPVYERALESHMEHGRRHGYPTFVLRRQLLGRLWSKPAYILFVLLAELQKPRESRLKWLFWFDADTVIINPKVPLEIFLPPSPSFDHIHFLCGNDHHGLNDGAFLLRVNDYAVHLMTAALSVECLRPDVDLKYSEQSAIEHVVHSGDFISHTGRFTYNDGYAEIPQRWMNAYMGPRHADGRRRKRRKSLKNSVVEGDMLLHFAGSGDTKRWRMTTFMDMLSTNSSAWEKDLDETKYVAEIAKFWSGVGKQYSEDDLMLADENVDDTKK